MAVVAFLPFSTATFTAARRGGCACAVVQLRQPRRGAASASGYYEEKGEEGWGVSEMISRPFGLPAVCCRDARQGYLVFFSAYI